MQDTTDVYNLSSLQRIIMEYCEDIVTIKNKELKYIACNKPFLKILSLENETNVINKKTEEILDSNISEVISKNTKYVVETCKTKNFTINILIDNQLKFFEITIYPIIEQGILSGVLTVGRDITKNETLKTSLLNKICQQNCLLENIPMNVYMKDLNNNYIIGSKYAREFANNGNDFYADNIKIDKEELEDKILIEDSNIINSKKSISKERVFISCDGAVHWYQIDKLPVVNINNDVNGILVIAKNIDKEKQIEAQKDLFLSTLTHDLKTPLQAQISTLQCLQKGNYGSINKSQKEIIDMIIESSCFMREMLYSILSTYKYEHGEVKLNKEFFNIDILIKKCIKEISNLAKEKNIKIEYNSEHKNIMIFGDENQIRRVIANLLNNGINYAFKNTTVNIFVCESEYDVIIRIKNYSMPISDEIKKHIFDKYVSGNGLNKRNGIGLGLYLCKQVTAAHNGEIYLNGNENENEFVLRLPMNNRHNSSIKFV